MSDKEIKRYIKVNWGQLLSLKGGIKRDARTFLTELEQQYSLDEPRPAVSNFKYIYSNRAIDLFSLLGLSVPSDLFRPKNFAEFQLSGRRFMRTNSSHIIRLHDLFPLTNPEWFRIRTRLLFNKALKAAVNANNATFICNSNFTQNKLREKFPNKTFVSYVLPCKYELRDPGMCNDCKGCQELLRIKKGFIIMVGTIEPRKSYQSIISSINEINNQIVIVGRYGWRQKRVAKELTKLEEAGKLLWLNNCCDGALIKYYKKAGFFLSTSIDEGYNISALEALRFEMKILLRKNPAHEEIYTTNAIYFNNELEMISVIKAM